MTAETQGMRIHAMRIENVKRIQLVDVDLDGGVVQFTGRNGSGKSSVLDAIWMALGGKNAQPTKPIRTGAKKASVKLDLGEMVVERRFREGGAQTLTVTAADGSQIRSPQTVLDNLVSRLAFDPLEFAGAKPTVQVTMLKDALGIDDSLVVAEINGRTIERRDVGRDRDRVDGWIAQQPKPDTKAKRVDVAGLMQQIREGQAANADREGLRDTLDRDKIQAADIDEQIAEFEAAKKVVWERITARTSELEAMPAAVDVEPLQQRVSEASETNKRADEAKRYKEQKAHYNNLSGQYDRLTDEIEKLREQREAMIAGADMPVEGLSFDESGISVGGIPFDQVSTREQIVLSTGIGIAMNPRLRIMFIRDGALLDSSGLAEIGQMAADGDFQILVERVTDGEPIGIVLADGQVVEHDTE